MQRELGCELSSPEVNSSLAFSAFQDSLKKLATERFELIHELTNEKRENRELVRELELERSDSLGLESFDLIHLDEISRQEQQSSAAD